MRKILVLMCAFAAVPAGVAIAGSEGLKVTGGGQVIGMDQVRGPGDTIAFNAQQTTGEENTEDGGLLAKGQLQVIQRDPAGGGRPEVKFHGEVTCITTFTDDQGTMDPSDDQRYVRFGGFQKLRGQPTTTPFTVDTADNGEGASGGNDLILFRTRGEGEDPCDESDPETQLRDAKLARGNVQEH